MIREFFPDYSGKECHLEPDVLNGAQLNRPTIIIGN